MKITNNQLKQIIKEELKKVLSEMQGYDDIDWDAAAKDAEDIPSPEFRGGDTFMTKDSTPKPGSAEQLYRDWVTENHPERITSHGDITFDAKTIDEFSKSYPREAQQLRAKH
jgi:hypothetical protein